MLHAKVRLVGPAPEDASLAKARRVLAVEAVAFDPINGQPVGEIRTREVFAVIGEEPEVVIP